MKIICEHCGNECEKKTGHVNRARSLGNKLYCNRTCAGFGRRKTVSEKKEIKHIYDKKYRQENLEKIKSEKKAYYEKNKKEIYAKQRKQRDNDEARAKHAAYCRQADQRAKETINRHKRIYGNDYLEKTKFCIACEEDKHIFEFSWSPIFPDRRRHICNECEEYQNHHYGYSTRLTLAALKSQRWSNLTANDFGEYPYLIEAKKFLILLTQLVQ